MMMMMMTATTSLDFVYGLEPLQGRRVYTTTIIIITDLFEYLPEFLHVLAGKQRYRHAEGRYLAKPFERADYALGGRDVVS